MGCSPEPINLQIAPSPSYSLSVGKCPSFPFSELPYSHFDEQLEDTLLSPLTTTVSIDSLEFYSHKLSFDLELVKNLKNIIKFRGESITVVEYMEKVLMNPIVGFNINRNAFGAEGDC
ncbi:NADH dehydrogenase ubiquinone complex I [Perilla frutescens var. hirtella]|nr:NADH dehydrogenase ubiquinone complex I [Perilla frutescens var. hirtella]